MIAFCLHLLGYVLAFWYSFFFFLALFLMLVHLFILISKKKTLLKKTSIMQGMSTQGVYYFRPEKSVKRT